MKLAGVVLLALLLACSTGLAQFRMLFVLESQVLEELVRLEALARALVRTGEVKVRAVAQMPSERWLEEPFQLVLVVPAAGRFVWLCTPAPAAWLPEPLAEAYGELVEAIETVFEGRRTVRGLEDDLYTWLLAARLSRLGVLEGVNLGD